MLSLMKNTNISKYKNNKATSPYSKIIRTVMEQGEYKRLSSPKSHQEQVYLHHCLLLSSNGKTL